MHTLPCGRCMVVLGFQKEMSPKQVRLGDDTRHAYFIQLPSLSGDVSIFKRETINVHTKVCAFKGTISFQLHVAV